MKQFTFSAPHHLKFIRSQLSEQNPFPQFRGHSLDCGFPPNGGLQQNPFSSIVRPQNIK